MDRKNKSQVDDERVKSQSGTENEPKENEDAKGVKEGTRDYDKELAELRRENAKWRKKLRELESEKEKKEEATLKEQEKYKELYEKEKEQRAKMEREIIESKKRRTLEAVATKSGFRDVEDIRLLDIKEEDWDGESFIGLEAKITKLKEKKPYLFEDNQPPNDGHTGSKTKSGSNENADLTNYENLTQEQREAILRKNIIKF